MKIEIKHKITNEVLFSHEQENNSIRITVEFAIKAKTDLSYANLSYANLSYANLRAANLSAANLSYANLCDANLRAANLSAADLSAANLRAANLSAADLSDANLRAANLSAANLSYANLCDANLSDVNLLCYGDMKFIFTLQIDNWCVGFTKEILQIGCQKHPISKWKEFTDEQILKMDSKALSWWKRWKQPLFAIIDERLKDAE
jgi:hypothetical protein